MRYTINIESAFRTNTFRLNKKNQWVRCSNLSAINEGDYVTTNRMDVIGLLKKDISIEIENTKFIIEPEMGTEYGNEKQLHYEIYGFRYDYPQPPGEKQLKDLLIAGDDSVRNSLVLKTDGLFYLLKTELLPDIPANPDIVLQYESFQSGNGYVGNSVGSDESYIKNLYRIGINYWLNHLRYKILHDFSEVEILQADPAPAIVELFEELQQLKLNWKPDYQLQSIM